jgi:hypothetical protein
VAAEEGVPEAVEGVRPDAVGGEGTDEGCEAFAELACGGDGVGAGEDGLGGEAAFADEVGDAFDDDAGLAGARSGEDEQGFADVGDGLVLRVVEGAGLVEAGGHVGAFM